MKVIGFANKYYTLWEITEETRYLGNGHRYVIVHNTFVKNISFDKETAFAKYPEAGFDETLRGKTHSWESKKEVWDNVDVFRFGKYKYDNIDSCSDTSYIEWYWNNIYDEHIDYVSNVLKNRGYEIRINTYINHEGKVVNSEYLMNPENLEIECQNKEKLNNTINELATGNPIEIFIESNPNDEGDYRDGDIIYHFQEVKENWYNGFNYYLPVLNGKAKRVKNKTIIIKNYTYKLDNDIVTIEVLDFDIEK